MQQLIPYSRGRLSAFAWHTLRKLKQTRRWVTKKITMLVIKRQVHDANSFHQTLDWLSKRALYNVTLVEGLTSSYLDAAGPEELKVQAAYAVNSDNTCQLMLPKLILATLHTLPETPVNRKLEFLNSIRIPQDINSATIKAITSVFNKSGFFENTVDLANKNAENLRNSLQQPNIRAAQEKHHLLRNGMPLADRIRCDKPDGPSRIMYCVSQCRPHLTSGYAIRTHEILRELKSQGLDIQVFARDGFPNDRWDFAGAPLSNARIRIDSIDYHFSPNRKFGLPNRCLVEYHERATDSFSRYISAFKPTIIHAASNFTCGLPAANAAAKAGIPFIYEMRGLWHLSRASRDSYFASSGEFQLQDRLEIDCAKSADKVLTITQSLADYIIDRGVDPAKVAILPNAVDTKSFQPLERDGDLAAKLQLQGSVVIGYVGSLIGYEGLDLLLDAVARVRSQTTVKFKLLIVGDGSEFRRLRQQTSQLEIEDIVHFTGRVAHDDVAKYYSLIDIVPLPRRGEKVCEIVSPLKPFEALAMEKTLVVSDVPALTEIVLHEETGMVHKRDCSIDLSSKLLTLLNNEKQRERLGRNGRKWVVENRTWKKACGQVLTTYSELTNDYTKAAIPNPINCKHVS